MTILCGVDVSKSWLDAWIEPAGHQRFRGCAAPSLSHSGRGSINKLRQNVLDAW